MPPRQSAVPTPDGQERLLELFDGLDLTALPGALSDILAAAEQAGLSYTDFAVRLLEAEERARRERKYNRNLKQSRLGAVEGLDGYDFSERPRLEERVVKELLHCRWVEERRNVICVGRPGLGKTRIAKALGRAAIERGYSVRYVVAAEMLEELHAALADHTYRRTFRRYAKPHVLIADEFGYEPFTPEATRYLFRLVSTRHGENSIVLCANTGFSRWKRFFPSEAQAVATVDRLIDRATILRFTGKSFRSPGEIHGAPDDEAD